MLLRGRGAPRGEGRLRARSPSSRVGRAPRCRAAPGAARLPGGGRRCQPNKPAHTAAAVGPLLRGAGGAAGQPRRDPLTASSCGCLDPGRNSSGFGRQEAAVSPRRRPGLGGLAGAGYTWAGGAAPPDPAEGGAPLPPRAPPGFRRPPLPRKPLPAAAAAAGGAAVAVAAWLGRGARCERRGARMAALRALLLLLGECGRGAPSARGSAPCGAAGAARPARWSPALGGWAVGSAALRCAALRGRLAYCRAALCPQPVAPRPAGCARLCTALRSERLFAESTLLERHKNPEREMSFCRGLQLPKENLRGEERADEIPALRRLGGSAG